MENEVVVQVHQAVVDLVHVDGLLGGGDGERVEGVGLAAADRKADLEAGRRLRFRRRGWGFGCDRSGGFARLGGGSASAAGQEQAEEDEPRE
jgi:hypothetical protein